MIQHGTRDPAMALATAALATSVNQRGGLVCHLSASDSAAPQAQSHDVAAPKPAIEVAREFSVVHHGSLPRGTEMCFTKDDEHVILMALRPASLKDAACRLADTVKLKTGNFMLIPAGSRSRWFIDQRQADFVELDLAAEALARIARASEGDSNPAANLQSTLGQQDMVIESIARACLFEVLSPTKGTQWLLESYGIGLAVHLFRKYCERPAEAARHDCAMSPFRLRLVLDFIEQNLEETLTMRDLAEAAGLSPYHFSRCFKRDTGFTPYRYILERRIARAKELITTSDMPLAQVALATGFGSQANFTSMFHRMVGMPPGVWRKANCW